MGICESKPTMDPNPITPLLITPRLTPLTRTPPLLQTPSTLNLPNSVCSISFWKDKDDLCLECNTPTITVYYNGEKYCKQCRKIMFDFKK